MHRIVIALAAAALSGCTFVRYDAGALTVIDLHPGGEQITLDGELVERGRISVNRQQGSSADLIGVAVDAAVGL